MISSADFPFRAIWFRAPALVPASGVTAIVCLSIAPFTELGPASAVATTFVLVGVLQVGTSQASCFPVPGRE